MFKQQKEVGFGKRTAYPTELKRQARDLFEQGRGYKSCATELNVPRYTVRDWKRSYDLGRFVQLSTPKSEGDPVKIVRYPQVVRDEVCRLRLEQGLSFNDISRRTGVTLTTIKRWWKLFCRCHGINEAGERQTLSEGQESTRDADAVPEIKYN